MKSIGYILFSFLIVLSACTLDNNPTGDAISQDFETSVEESENKVMEVKGPVRDSNSLTQIESKYVCMMNQNVYVKEQILVEVNGLNYYGCCQGCVNALMNDPTIRVAIDPVSGNQVDKATAIIGEYQGKAYYFESLENLESFDPN